MKISFVEKISFFWLKRLFSLAGVVPVGAFLLFHYYTNSKFLEGADTFQHGVNFLHSFFPVILFWEIFMIWLPLAFHGTIGIIIYFNKGQGLTGNVANYPFSQNWWWLIRRVTGVVTLLFIIWHVAIFRFMYNPGSSNEFAYGAITGNYVYQVTVLYKDPLIFLLMLIGVLASAFHFGSGIWSFCITWGITISRASQKWMFRVGMAFALFIAALGVLISIQMRSYDQDNALKGSFMSEEDHTEWQLNELSRESLYDPIINEHIKPDQNKENNK